MKKPKPKTLPFLEKMLADEEWRMWRRFRKQRKLEKLEKTDGIRCKRASSGRRKGHAEAR